MEVKKILHLGWNNCYQIKWHHLVCIVTTDVGPRIISLSHSDTHHEMFAFAQADAGKTGGDSWRLYGGHRLWTAPEVDPRTYYPDNDPVELISNEDSVTLKPPHETVNNVAKTIIITGRGGSGSTEPYLEVRHQVTNISRWPIELAPWAITVMCKQTRAIVPLSELTPGQTPLQAKTSLSIWNYTKLNDPRFIFGEKYLLVDQQPTATTTNKIGAQVNNGWTAAVNGTGSLFVKLINRCTRNLEVDHGANVEVYLSPDIVELETVGPLERIEPGQHTDLVENWFLFRDVKLPTNDSDVESNVLPLVRKVMDQQPQQHHHHHHQHHHHAEQHQ
ncbi:hypothetical protein SAMD00019534_014610 [Acytostelium subglobosum LB1]|uniref:hypothetical protein n=1 Tax=Acytostelium subglobosum LB1 TaxID=1410327 RepID=UPI000644D9D2|nr:hypothetical protein SAMD00019534_014610 [Acytostelium subglobosum LB1]GAM18286.1 hypothetical protein SAMD00019534_014610 [Acytostelium subglobosum LB1]|eukprot:XP_012758882.1 hypothetical protein SAMD00019534_014610 [Acytostelium subglobosum LB1]